MQIVISLFFRDSRNTLRHSLRLPEKCTVIGEKVLEDGCTLVVADLSFSQQKQDRAPMPVINDMEFGFRPPFVL